MSKQVAPTKGLHASPHGQALLRNLRLLDFDEEFDWPQITGWSFVATDGVRNLQKRIFAAGWIAYKLLEVLEPKETKHVSSRLWALIGKCRLIDLIIRIWKYTFPLSNQSSPAC